MSPVIFQRLDKLILYSGRQFLFLFLRALVLMLLFGLTNVVGVIILMLIHNADISAAYLLFYSRVPALIGLALGIGFDVFEIIKDKLRII